VVGAAALVFLLVYIFTMYALVNLYTIHALNDGLSQEIQKKLSVVIEKPYTDQKMGNKYALSCQNPT
jgi:hypothetical protein